MAMREVESHPDAEISSVHRRIGGPSLALKKDFAQTTAWFQCLLQVSKMSGTTRPNCCDLFKPWWFWTSLPHQSLTHQAPQQNSFGLVAVPPAVAQRSPSAEPKHRSTAASVHWNWNDKHEEHRSTRELCVHVRDA